MVGSSQYYGTKNKTSDHWCWFDVMVQKVEENAGDVKESSARSVVEFLQSRPQANK